MTKNEHRILLNPQPLQRFVMRGRLVIVRAVVKMLLPRDIWVGNHFGAYTQKWQTTLGRLDSRGVLQGVSDKDV